MVIKNFSALKFMFFTDKQCSHSLIIDTFALLKKDYNYIKIILQLF